MEGIQDVVFCGCIRVVSLDISVSDLVVCGMGYLDEDYVGPGFGEGDGHCGADAAGSAGDEGGAAIQGEEGVGHFISLDWRLVLLLL